MKICDYGCGQPAIIQFKNGKWCCSDHYLSCPATKDQMKNQPHRRFKRTKESLKKQKETVDRNGSFRGEKNGMFGRKGELNPFYGKHHSDDLKTKWRRDRNGSQLGEKNNMYGKIHPNRSSIEKIYISYPTFSKIEEMRYNPDKLGEKEIQVRCKNHNCSNSKEKDGWFTPTRIQISERLRQIENENGCGGSYFYCCNECKQECPLYGKSVIQLIKKDQIKAGIINESQYTPEEYNTWRQEVLKRADYKCEYCGELAEHCHHIKPQKLEPFFSLDPDYGIACCVSCHYEKGHKDECSTGKLANIRC